MAKNEGNKVVNRSNDVIGLIATVQNHKLPKSVKEAALGRIREIERKTGVSLYGKYNGEGTRPLSPSELARLAVEEQEMGD